MSSYYSKASLTVDITYLKQISTQTHPFYCYPLPYFNITKITLSKTAGTACFLLVNHSQFVQSQILPKVFIHFIFCI